MVWIIQQKVSLLLLKTNTHFKLEPKRIQTIELMWRALDAEIGAGSYAWGAEVGDLAGEGN